MAGEFSRQQDGIEAQVETDDSIRDIATVSEWKETVVHGIPFYLLVPTRPQGVGTATGRGAAVPVSGIDEYTVVKGLCQVR